MHDSTTFPRRVRFAPGQTITALRSSEEFFARAKTVCRFARFILFPGRFPAVSFPVCVCVSFPVFVLTVSRLKPAEYGFSSSPRRLQRFLKHARRSEAAASLFLRFLRVSPRDASGAFPGGLSMF